MGLSERKVKQRIGADPRNLSWAGNTDRFSYKHLSNLGWSGSGLGSGGDGNPNHIAVARKVDNGGIGMGRARKEGEDNAAGAGQAGRGLEDVLRRLASATNSPSASPSPAPESPVAEGEEKKEVKLRNKVASRQRHLLSKKMASQSPAALAEILGVPVSSLPTSPAPSSPSLPATPALATPPVDADAKPSESSRDSEETTTTSTLSVADYFRKKMREKLAQRQAAMAGQEMPELAADSLARVKEEKKVPIGGAGWEGVKVKFEDADNNVLLADLGGDVQPEAGPSSPTVLSVKAEPELDEKAAKRARKEAKRLSKLAKEASKSSIEIVDVKPDIESIIANETAGDSVKAEKKSKKEKKEKRDKKSSPEVEAGVTSADDKATRKEKKKRKRAEEEDAAKDNTTGTKARKVKKERSSE